MSNKLKESGSVGDPGEGMYKGIVNLVENHGTYVCTYTHGEFSTLHVHHPVLFAVHPLTNSGHLK